MVKKILTSATPRERQPESNTPRSGVIVRKQYVLTQFTLVLFFSLLLLTCEKKNDVVRIGHGGGYLSAAVFAAQCVSGETQEVSTVDLQQFNSSSDIAYGLLSGTLDAGFVEADRLAAFSKLKGFERLTVAGKITYPYGATLVLRKGLNIRLNELSRPPDGNNLTVAVSAPHCVLLEQFAEDADRLGADLSNVKYLYMPFDTMLPALGSRTVDAVIIKGTYSVVALHEGHSILYQNWDMKPGDECCPAVIDQAALVLLVRKDKIKAVQNFLTALSATQNLSPDQLRQAVADNTILPFEILQGQPVPEFSLADDELLEIFIEAADEHHEGEHED